MSSWLMLPESLYDLLRCSLYVTEAAIVILLVKGFFREQLSARWHFYIWGILFFRLTVPPEKLHLDVGSGTVTQLLNPELATGALRSWIDSMAQNTTQMGHLLEGHSGIFEANRTNIMLANGEKFPLSEVNYDSLPVFQGAAPFENSFQQALIVVYAVVVVLLFLYFIGTYFSLLLRLRRASPASDALNLQVCACRERLGLRRKVKVITTDEFDNPFVCGLIFPSLVLPAEMEADRPDDKIILHELIHVKHAHVALNWILNIFRCIHFFNPIMWYTFGRIQNDCELLCDERLLKLYGSVGTKEHEEYGELLLNAMVGSKNMMPGTSSLSNGQKNILNRIRRIRGFWKLSDASGTVAFLLSILIGVYCLSGSSSVYAVDQMKSGFGFSSEVFDYNVFNAEQYRLKSPVEAAYGYALALTEWPVNYEWLYLTDEERSDRREHKIENEENGVAFRHKFYRPYEDVDKVPNEIINSLDEAEISIYNLCRKADGTYGAIVRLQTSVGWLEDHIVVIGIREGRYTVLSDETMFYRFVNSDVPLPYHAAVYTGTDSGRRLSIDYRMDCQTTHKRNPPSFMHEWTQRHMPKECIAEIALLESGEETAADVLTAVEPVKETVHRVPGTFEKTRTFSQDLIHEVTESKEREEIWRLTESYGYRVREVK